MGKCQAVTDGYPCGQQEQVYFDSASRKYVGTELCYYHTKMRDGLILPYREHDVKVVFNNRILNKR